MKYTDSSLTLSHDEITHNRLGFRKPENSDYLFLNQASPITILACMIALKDSNLILVLGNTECTLKADFESEPGLKVVIFTSGSTGTPKAVLRNFSDLIPRGAEESDRKFTWGLLFDSEKMAGLQVLLSAYYRKEALCCPAREESLSNKIAFFKHHNVNALSATPSLWRNMLQLDSIVGLNLIQITIGGEKSDNLLLRELRSRFPVANISQIYASSELGYIFSVKDNLAGFPIQYLEKKFLRVNSHGELFVKRAGVWHGTGDLVRLVNDRYMFVGRVDSIVNIGGVKVDPSAVENIIRSLDGVLDALVTGVKNPILGAILVAEVIVTEDSGLSEIDLKNRLEVVLDRVQIPAVIKVVTAFSLNSNGKRRLSN